MRKKERFVLGKRTFRSQKSKHFVLRIIHEVAMKTFVDFYAISKASRVIRILAPEMYNTVFSYYAAVLGGIIPEELHV